MAKRKAKGGDTAVEIGARQISVREEICSTSRACDTVVKQLRDDIIVRAVEQAIEDVAETVEHYGTIWLCGNGAGFCMAAEVAQQLATPSSRYERETRAAVLGANGAMSTTSYGKCGVEEALAAELRVNGRSGDSLWCFASDAGSQALLGAAAFARQDLKIPVVVFAPYPGTPLIRFATSKIRIQSSDDRDHTGFCAQSAHAFLARIMCNQIKRFARKVRNDANK